jgi:hypothetical protein
MALQEATQKIKSMHGEFRIPTLLKMLDGSTKKTFKLLLIITMNTYNYIHLMW